MNYNGFYRACLLLTLIIILQDGLVALDEQYTGFKV